MAHICEVGIADESVEFYKILKFDALVTTGGESKLAIGGGLVMVNYEVPTGKRGKIINGETIGMRLA